jgi:plasmid stabilization system protein ParE
MVKRSKLSIIWTENARNDFKEVLSYYKSKSPLDFKLVKEAILFNIQKISTAPNIFERDKLKKDENLSFRVFIVYHTRVTYQITKTEIIIHRIRHTSREPLGY